MTMSTAENVQHSSYYLPNEINLVRPSRKIRKISPTTKTCRMINVPANVMRFSRRTCHDKLSPKAKCWSLTLRSTDCGEMPYSADSRKGNPNSSQHSVSDDQSDPHIICVTSLAHVVHHHPAKKKICT